MAFVDEATGLKNSSRSMIVGMQHCVRTRNALYVEQPVDHAGSFVSTTRPVTDRLQEVVESWAKSQYELVTLAAEFADSPEWILTGSPTAAHWLAIIADVEPCTCREWRRSLGLRHRTAPEDASGHRGRVQNQ